jgi:outer membrane receptor protein involved in Fe transport
MLAVRVERYSDVGTSVTPKIGFSVLPIGTVRVHGSFGTAFSAPRYSDTLIEFNTLIIQRFPSPACASGACLVAEEFGAQRQYQPERSRSFDIGLDWDSDRLAGLQVHSTPISLTIVTRLPHHLTFRHSFPERLSFHPSWSETRVSLIWNLF